MISPQTLFYCDPPYIHETRGGAKAYSNEMNDQDHKELARVLNSVQGLVAVSNYDCDFMSRLYPANKWIKTTGPEKTIHTTKDKRAENLWTNYDPEKTVRPGVALENEDIQRDFKELTEVTVSKNKQASEQVAH